MIMIVPGRLPGLNEYTNQNRKNRYAGATMKGDVESLISLYIPNWDQYTVPVRLEFHWYEPKSNRDCDNIAFAKKFILDALVNKGVLKNDNQKWVKGFSDHFYVDKENPRIVVDIHPFE
jgi:Holliday junction resolvase RusA-like endonuclease